MSNYVIGFCLGCLLSSTAMKLACKLDIDRLEAPLIRILAEEELSDGARREIMRVLGVQEEPNP